MGMGRHRIALRFDDETTDDRARWEAWAALLPERVRAAVELGELRPLISVAAPFPSRDALGTPRDHEVAGLAVARSVVEAAASVAATTGRGLTVLLSGKVVGRIAAKGGPDATLTALLEEWQRLVDVREPDEPEWEREGWVSVWAGVLPPAEMEHLFAETYRPNGPNSPFARALGIGFYDHDDLEWQHSGEPVPLEVLVRQRSFAATFAQQVPEEQRRRMVNAIAVLYGTDFTKRPKSASRRRLVFIGSFAYES